jgi:Na+-translocating ferredoxin:NAD+ oxidoreductase RnfC subunit
MGPSGLAELLQWGGVRERWTPARARVLVVAALDAFPGQASSRATLDTEIEDVIAGAARLAGGEAGESVLAVRDPEVEGIRTRFERRAEAGLSILAVPDLHPLGSPEVLAGWLASCPRFDGARPADFRIVGVDTAAAVGAALRGRPRLDRWVTVAGRVRSPGTYQVPLGTTASTLRALSGGGGGASAVSYGVTRGRLRRIPLSRGLDLSDGLVLFLAPDHPLAANDALAPTAAVRRLAAGCSRCGVCDALCPSYAAGMRVRELVDTIRYDLGGPGDPGGLGTCIGCRLCETACPAFLPVGRIASEIAERLRGGDVAVGRAAGPRLVPREALRGRLGLGPDPDARRDARHRVRRVRLSLACRTGPAAVPCRRPGERVWRGEPVALTPDGAARVLAPISGTVRGVDGCVTISRGRP